MASSHQIEVCAGVPGARCWCLFYVLAHTLCTTTMSSTCVRMELENFGCDYGSAQWESPWLYLLINERIAWPILLQNWLTERIRENPTSYRAVGCNKIKIEPGTIDDDLTVIQYFLSFLSFVSFCCWLALLWCFAMGRSELRFRRSHISLPFNWIARLPMGEIH